MLEDFAEGPAGRKGDTMDQTIRQRVEELHSKDRHEEIVRLLERLEVLNRERGTTILMVTHDAFTASCCRRVVFLRDGQIFQELSRGELDRRAFFAQIIRVITQLGGEMEDVL